MPRRARTLDPRLAEDPSSGLPLTRSGPRLGQVPCKGAPQCSATTSDAYWWGLHRCDCPAGRNGLVCAGCSTDEGCPAGQRCAAPFAPRQTAADARLVCNIVQVSPEVLTPVIFDFADEAVLTMD